VSQALERIRKAARERKKKRFTTLYDHIDADLLEEAFAELKEDAAPGVDRLRWTDYEADLEARSPTLGLRRRRGIDRRYHLRRRRHLPPRLRRQRSQSS
jgi:hypothetical protein